MMQLGSNSPRQDQPPSPRPPPRPHRQQPIGPPVYSLFIADIHPSITEIDLLELFAKSGTVLSIHLVRDRITRAPLGYGYVNFERADEAERALKEHNYITLGDTGRPLRIMWSRRNSAGKEWPPAANVFFKSLASKTTSSVLHWVCAHFGEVLACKVVVDEETGLSKCYGFVQFEEEEAARKAIATLNGSTIDDSKVFAGRFIPKQEREAALVAEGVGRPQRTYHTTLYVKNLTGQLDSREKLERLFGQCGTVVSAAVALDEATQQSKGFGFVTFSSSEEAERAISELNGRVMEEGGVAGKEVRLYVGLLQKKAEREARKRKLLEQRKQAKKLERQKEGVNLYVKNLDPGVDDQRLKTAFASFGTITSARVMTTEPRTEGTNVKGREGQTLIPQKNSEGGGGARTVSRGFGFVCFSRPEEALKAKTELHSKAVEGLSALGKPLYVGLAQSRAQREAWKVRMRYGGGGWAQAGAIHSKQHSSSEYPLSMPSMIEVFGHGQQQNQRIPLPYLAHGQAQLSVVLNVHPFVNPNLGPPPVHYQDGPSLVEQAVLPPGFHIDAQSGQIVYDGRRRLGVERRAIAGTYHVPGAPARPDL